MSDDPAPTALHNNGVHAWIAGWHVVAVTPEGVFARRFETAKNRQRAAERIAQGEPARQALGMLTKSMPLDAIRSVCQVPGMGVLVVRGGSLFKEPVRLDGLDEGTADEIFETLRGQCGAGAVIETSKASINDVPVAPQLAGSIIFGLIAIACLIYGALQTGPIEGNGRFAVLGAVGKWIGPLPAILIGVAALGAAVFFAVVWWRNLPQKRFFSVDR